MALVRDPDAQLVAEMLAPPKVEDARSSLDFWLHRRRRLPLYRVAARREATRMAAVWQARLQAAEQARFDASMLGRVLATVGLARFWPTRPRLDVRMLIGLGWMLAPPQVKAVAAWTALCAIGVLVGSIALVALALGLT